MVRARAGSKDSPPNPARNSVGSNAGHRRPHGSQSNSSGRGGAGFSLRVVPEPADPGGGVGSMDSNPSPRASHTSSLRSKAHNRRNSEEVRNLVHQKVNSRPRLSVNDNTSATVSSMGSARNSHRNSRASVGSARSMSLAVEEKRSARCCRVFAAMRKKAAPYCRSINKNKVFQALMFVALLCALFLPDIWILADRPNNDDLDVVLTLVLAAFLFELVVQSVGLTRSYWGSFFFWMDLLGAVSLLLDLTYLGIMSGGGDAVSSNVVIMRAARIAKLGARAGRFTRLVKLLRFLPGMREQGTDAGTAKVISSRLITALSTRVSCLIIVMVMVMPMFSMWTYPEQDWSMKSWLDVLEKTNQRSPEKLARQLVKFENFYSDMNYYPYNLRAKPGVQLSNWSAALLPWQSSRSPPQRMTNSVKHESATLECDFNFKQPYQIDSLMNVLLLLVVMVLMVGFSLVLSNSVSAIVLRPLEKLLMQVRKMASTIFQSVTDMACTMRDAEEENDDDESEEEDDGNNTFGNETVLLEKVVQKLAVLSEITMNKSVVDAETLRGLGEGDKAVIHGFQGHSGAEAQAWKDGEEEGDMESMLLAQKAMLENAGLSLELLNSWNLNPLELDKARNHAAAMYFVGPHNHSIAFDPILMVNFLEAAELSYVKTCPYHNWFHAIDVTHGVYRLLHINSTDAYLSCNERYALLISAVCHDVGHPGLNNTFLIETSHDLALRYNDKSPLENMHCAKLFEIVAQAKCNIFATLGASQYQDVRKVCIDAILNTDNAQHFTMIKEVQMIYEVNSEILEASRDLFAEDPENFPPREAMECFREPESRKLLTKALLHVADISNSMKPFRVCRLWAWQVLEEFFLQGDAEKRLGVPVQALNDREKVNRPFSQVGFIEFLVSPLVFAVIRVLPPTEGLAEQMIQNVRQWHSNWRNETKPPPSDAEQTALAERVHKLEAKYLECH